MSNTRGAYVGLGLCLGVALGAATHNVGLGAALGILVGSIARGAGADLERQCRRTRAGSWRCLPRGESCG